MRTEQKYGDERSRIDVLARDGAGRCVYIEVKNTTLRVGQGVCFPDAVTVRGTKHLRELRAMVRLGHRAAIVFFVQRGDAVSFDAAREIDPAYARELDLAEAGRGGDAAHGRRHRGGTGAGRTLEPVLEPSRSAALGAQAVHGGTIGLKEMSRSI